MTLEQAIDDLMDASRTIAEAAESESDEANRINAQNCADDCKQIAELLRELQERRKQPEIRYLTDVEIASAVGACTIYSANSWIYFARTMHELGLEVIERRTDGEKQSD